jgi:hypothetical protein
MRVEDHYPVGCSTHANPLIPPSSPDATTFPADVDMPALDSSSRDESKVGCAAIDQLNPE